MLVIVFNNRENFKWEFYMSGHIDEKKPISGYYEDIYKKVLVSDINGRGEWNKVMKIVENCMVEVARIFGFDGLPQIYWRKDGELDYSSGLSSR